MVLASVACGVVLALYVLTVYSYVAHRPDSDILEQVALKAVNKLAEINVEDPSLGMIGLCDQPGEGSPGHLDNHPRAPILGINTLYAVIRLDALIADKLKHPLISALLADDFVRAQALEKQLTEKLYQAVEKRHLLIAEGQPNFLGFHTNDGSARMNRPEAKNFIYKAVYRQLESSLAMRNCRLIDLTIRLGFVRTEQALSQVRAPEKTATTLINSNGEYQTGVPITIPNLGLIMFTTLVNKTKILDPTYFIADARRCAPAAVLIETVYETKSPSSKGGSQLVRRAVAAAVGSAPLQTQPAALVITCPHGLPNLFSSVRDILFYQNWQSQGIWRQAAYGEVPGHGRLIRPSQLLVSEMFPSDALALMVYHWMRLLQANADVDQCLRLISQPWNIAPATSPASNLASQEGDNPPLLLNPVNSCLAKDTEARTATLLEQSYPGGNGQLALHNVFAKTELNFGALPAPSSAIPLFVDRSGNCNLPGHHGFDENLIKGFISAVYETNLAAIESLWVAKLMTTKSTASLAEVEQKLMVARQELSSISNRTTRLSNAKAAENKSPRSEIASGKEIDLLRQRVVALKEEIAANQGELIRLRKLNQLAAVAADNARHAATSTYDIAAHAFQLCRNGIFPIDNNGKIVYLLGKHLSFFPFRRPLSESDLLDASEPRQSASTFDVPSTPQSNQSWLSERLTITRDVDTFLHENDPVNQLLSARLKAAVAHEPLFPALTPLCIVLDSQSLTRKKPAKANVYSTYPFLNILVPNGQFLYYCQNAVETGSKPSVSWAVLARDLVASRTKDAPGSPINSYEQDWCHEQGETLGICPGLACEFQFRTPLPKLPNLPEGSYVSNEAGERACQLPPVPAEML